MFRRAIENQENAPSPNALAVACHEIRGSLAAIIAHAELMCEGKLTERRREEVAELIASNSHGLLHVLDDVLQAAEVDVSGAQVEIAPCQIRKLLDDLLELYAQQADSRGLFFELEVAPTLPATIMSDSNALRRILVNLVANAIKFTETGGVCLRVEWNEDSQVCIQIEDTGIGIAPQELEQVFGRFVRGSGEARNTRGSGLGLALSRDLARALSGDLTASSELGRGSTFTLEFPVPSADVSEQRTQLHGLHVLVAEDCPDGRRLLSHHLRTLGASVSLCANGEELIALFETRRVQDAVCDAILLDLEMPCLDGRKTADVLRNRGYSGPLLALSAHGAGPEQQRAISSGCDVCLSKPIDRDRLANALGELLGPVQKRLAG